LSLLRKGDADILARRVQLQDELSIFDVLLGQCGAVNLHIWHVHSLPGFEFASANNLDLELSLRDLLHDLDFHETILDEQHGADHTRLHQGVLLYGWLHGDTARPNVVGVILADAELQDVAAVKVDVGARATRDLGHPELRALKVTKALHLLAHIFGVLPDKRIDPLEVSIAAMGAVQSEDVRTRLDHLRDHLLTPGGWSQARNHLGLALAVIHLPGLVCLVHEVIVQHLRHKVVLHALCLEDCVGFGPYRLQGEVAGGGLAAEHHGVGTIPNGVLQVSNLCPGRHRLVDHTLDHLGGRDHKQARLLCLFDQELLCEGYSLYLEFHAEVSSCYHQGLRLRDDAVDVRQCLGLLDLGADLRPLLLGHLQPVHDVDELLKVLGLLREGDTDVLDGRV